MILIADGGSTKVDWFAFDTNNNEVFKTRTEGLNPVIISTEEIKNRINRNATLNKYKNDITNIYFYGAGCSSKKMSALLSNEFQKKFNNAQIEVKEDIMAAVYAASKGKEAIVCILGTGSNATYFDGKTAHQNTPSLGFILMDEASGNYFGKILLQDYFYKNMPSHLAKTFASQYNLDADEIKRNLYQENSPNAYLGTFAKFMYAYKTDKYINSVIKNGFTLFFDRHILPFNKTNVPIYFIGSIAFYFEDILTEIALSKDLNIHGVLQRPINKLIEYHKNNYLTT